MHVLLATAGIGGDNLPLIAWAQSIRARGHEVHFLGNGAYASAAEAVGLPFTSVISVADHQQRSQLRGHSPLKAVVSGLQNMITDIRPLYRELWRRYRPGESIVVAHGLCLGARLLQDRWEIPLATVHISPTALRSRFDPAAWPERLPRWMHRFAADQMTKGADRNLGPALARYRRMLDILPLARPVREWMHSPQLVIGLWPDWFAAPQLDWPPETRLVGFPLPRLEETPPLPPEVEAFLASGAPPLVFSHTSGVDAAVDFYRESIRLCQAVGRRGIILAPAEVPLPDPLPAGVIRPGPLPHVRLYPRAALAVHHGGVGTAAVAFAAGVPQFIVPAMYDHPEVGRRAKALGVAAAVAPKDFRVERVTSAVLELLDSPTVKARCEEIRQRSATMHAHDDAIDLLETLAQRFGIAGCGPTRRVG
jgi:rhamnosyltransferase subunit B